MRRRNRRGLRPGLDQFEYRVLLSAITDALSSEGLHSAAHAHAAQSGSGGGTSSGSFASSINLGSSRLNQGPVLNPDGSINNMALAPSGTPKPGEIKRQRFTARYVGPYSVVPGRTTTQATQVLIQGAGTANTMLHSDIQMRLVTPKDASQPIGGVSTIFDRNINSNTALGLDLSAPQQDVDRSGRPSHIPTVSTDANISSGTYVESYAQGVINIRYIPSGKAHRPA